MKLENKLCPLKLMNAPESSIKLGFYAQYQNADGIQLDENFLCNGETCAWWIDKSPAFKGCAIKKIALK